MTGTNINIDFGMDLPSARFKLNCPAAICELTVHSTLPAASEIFTTYLSLFPAFEAESASPVSCRISIYDVSASMSIPVAASVVADDPVFQRLRNYFAENYPFIEEEMLAKICSPQFIRTRKIKAALEAAMNAGSEIGLSCQRDMLVMSDLQARWLVAFVDCEQSVQEYYAFHVLNFYKVFAFRENFIRLHGSSFEDNGKLIVFLANSQVGKSTLKDFYLKSKPAATTFTDDSILVKVDKQSIALYQDPVEFLRWCFVKEDERASHAIPAVQVDGFHQLPHIYYLQKANETRLESCDPGDVFDLVNQEAFYKGAYLKQRFVPQPDQRRFLDAYYDNSRRFLARCDCHLLHVKYHDDYRELFESIAA